MRSPDKICTKQTGLGSLVEGKLYSKHTNVHFLTAVILGLSKISCSKLVILAWYWSTTSRALSTTEWWRLSLTNFNQNKMSHILRSSRACTRRDGSAVLVSTVSQLRNLWEIGFVRFEFHEDCSEMTVPVRSMTFSNREMINVYAQLAISEEEDKHRGHIHVHSFSLSISSMTQVLVR